MGDRHDVGSRRRRRGVVAVVVAVCLAGVVGAAVAATWSRTRQDDHVATAVVMLHPLEGNAFSPVGRGDELVNLETEAQLVRSDAVAGLVLERLGASGDPSALLADVSVSVPPNTQLLEISASAADEATAVARASAFADVFLDYRKARTRSALFERTARLEELVDKREAEREAALALLDRAAPNSAAAALAEQQVQEVTVQISSLRAQLAAALATSLDPGQLVTPGTRERSGPLDSPLVITALGAMAAAALCLGGLLFWRGREDPLVWHPDDLERVGPPVLGQVMEPVGHDSDAVVMARSRILSVSAGRPVVVCVGPAQAAEPAKIYPALVAAFTRARYEVIAVDLTRPESADAIGELVFDEATADDVLEESRAFLSELRPVGTPPAGRRDELSDLAASAGMAHALAEFAKRADVVLVRPGALLGPLGRALMARADATLVETRAGVSRLDELEELVDVASHTDSPLVGILHVQPALPPGVRARIGSRMPGQ